MNLKFFRILNIKTIITEIVVTDLILKFFLN